ncbi:SCAN box domain-containing protein [Trichonephila clavipes]|nr:SCAN box domain-containing protein [Trichonephila clavipes]
MLELSQQIQPLNDESGRRVEIGPKIQLTQIRTKFDEKHDEISLYLINFERKAELAQVPKKELQKSAEKSWRNYAHELNSYFTEWIAELQVKTFEQLKDLLITEQLKYRVPAKLDCVFGDVITKAAVLRDSLDQGKYLLGNKSAALFEELKKNKEIQVYIVNAVEKRSQKKLTEESKQDLNMSEETIPESNEKNKESPDELDDILPLIQPEISESNLIKLS